MFYVYIHRKETNGDPFYVGKGKGKRAWNFSGRNTMWRRIKDKHGCVVEILKDNLSEEAAFKLEIETISSLRKQYLLSNLTDGGEGLAGHVPTSETRAKISAIHKGRVKSDKERLNLSLAQKGRVQAPQTLAALLKANIGKRHTDECKMKMSKDRQENPFNIDSNVYAFFTKEDVFIGTRRELSKYTGLNSRVWRTLFKSNPYRSTQGWSVLNFQSLLIFKELYDYCN